MFAGKNLHMTQKTTSRADLINKSLTRCVKIDACAAAKHKIILSWPKMGRFFHTSLEYCSIVVQFCNDISSAFCEC